MKIIVIKAIKDGQFNRLKNKNADKDFNKWVFDSNKKIGYCGKNYLFTGNPKIKWEFSWIKGRLFHRYDGEGFFQVCDYFKNAYPDIICECDNSMFILEYGSCELFAKCPKCGKTDSVYSG